MDKITQEQRSWNMSRIKSKNTNPEIMVRKYLFSYGFRYRLHDKNLPGKPDIVLPKYKTVIFVHGCFWHGHKGCSRSNIPKSNEDYWNIKLKSNEKRDIKISAELSKLGFKILVIWECEVSLKEELNNLIKSIINA